MKFLLVLLFALFSRLCFAQQVVDVNNNVKLGSASFNMFIVNGTPFVNTKYVSLVEGSPYFSDLWMKGVLVGEDDVIYKDVSLRLDLFENKIHFKDAKGNEMISSTPLKELVITDILGNDFKFVHVNTKTKDPLQSEKWYMWMASGTASLYKLLTKRLSEQKPYNSATVEQSIHTTEKYMVLHNNSLVEIKKIKDAPGVLSDKKKELEDYLKTKDDKNKSMDARFLALIEYYNSLVKDIL